MAAILLHTEAAKAMVKKASEYGEEHKRSVPEMGLALMLAAMTVLSPGMNNVQIEEAYRHIEKLTAPLRKKNAS